MPYANRRQRLADALGDGILILVAPPTRQRSNDTEYAYRASSDILYLCGFDEPETVFILAPNHPEHAFVLCVRPRDRDREIWDGIRYGPDGAVQSFGANAAYPIEDVDDVLLRMLEGASTLHYQFGANRTFDEKIHSLLQRLGPTRTLPNRAPTTVQDPRPTIHAMRRIKDAHEVPLLERACRISADAHLKAMRATKPGMNEYEIRAIIEYEFMRQGAASPAYTSIVAGGTNACILHYIQNNKELVSGDLLLVDAGAEWQYYAGDITRTWPVGRTFSSPQRDIYQVVLNAQRACIERCVVGASQPEIHAFAIRSLVEGMIDIGLLTGDVDTLIETDAYRRFFMHGIGHYLGLDVHDVGAYLREDGSPIPFEPGVVLTIEPGIYVHPDDTQAPEAFRGIGVRIEDDVLVTDVGFRVLTESVPKEIDEIEALRA